ncbi:MAG: hypothetical protein LBR67_05460, partial [Dysgonamonadaceae bacterium]|nr:hypothetical protein [Dysgonamonadaceae bacterium]
KYSDGSAKIYLPNFTYTGTSGLVEMGVLSLVTDSNNPGEYVCAIDYKNLTIPPRGGVLGQYYSNPKYIPMSDDTFFWKYISDSLYYSSPTVQATFPIGNGWSNPVYMGTDAKGRLYFGMMYVTTEKAWAEIWSLTIPNPGAIGGAKLEYKSPTNLGLNATSNGNLTGDIAFDWTDDHPIIYILACNQGIAAYEATTVSKAGTDLYSENVNVLWERTSRENTLPTWFGNYYHCYRLAYTKIGSTPYLFYGTSYVNYSSGEPIYYTGTYVVDPATGRDLGKLPDIPADYLNKGKWNYQALAASEDGKVFVSNVAGNSPRSEDDGGGKTFNIVMYSAIDQDPQLVVTVEDIPAFTSLGNRMQATGKYSDGSLKIYVPNMYFTGADGANPQTQEIYIFSMMTPGPGMPQVINPTPQKITITNNSDRVVGGTWDNISGLGAYNNTAYIPITSSGDTYYWMDSYNGLYYKSPTFTGRVDEDEIGEQTNSLVHLGKDNDGNRYLAFITYSTGTARVVESNNPAEGVTVKAVTPMMFDAVLNNTNVQGDAGVAFAWDGDHPIIYTISANMGFGAYEITSIGKQAAGVNIIKKPESQFTPVQIDGTLYFTGDEAVKSITLYSITGQKVIDVAGVSQISTGGLKGVFIAKVIGISGKETVVKTVLK